MSDAAAAGADRGRRHRRPPLSRHRDRRGDRRATGGEAVFVGTARGLETQAGAGGRLPARADQGQRPQAHGPARPAARAGAAAARVPRVARASCAATAPTSCWASAATPRGRWCSRRRCSAIRRRSRSRTACPGFTNRMLGRFVRRVFVAFDEAAARVRAPQGPLPRQPGAPRVPRAAPPRSPAATPTDAKSIVILGGSQGSRAVNELASGDGARARRARAAAAHRPPDRRRPVRRDAGQLRGARLRGARRRARVHRRHAGRAGRGGAGASRAPAR